MRVGVRSGLSLSGFGFHYISYFIASAAGAGLARLAGGWLAGWWWAAAAGGRVARFALSCALACLLARSLARATSLTAYNLIF